MSRRAQASILGAVGECARPRKPSTFRRRELSRATSLPCGAARQLSSSRVRRQQHEGATSPASSTYLQHEESSTQLPSPPRAPRWSHTPPRMVAPVPLNKHHPSNRFRVNEDPEKLDAVYNRILGDGGDKILTEEVKWLAVTHKSFDQGRRGYNDRLAFLGRRIVSLQVSLALLNRTDGTFNPPPDEYGREPFRHPGVDLLPRLSAEGRIQFLERGKIAMLANRMGLATVVRWKPRQADDLIASGSDSILCSALYAIVGAVALQRGGEMAVRVVKERILSQLGLKA